MAKPNIKNFYKENYDGQIKRAEDYAAQQKTQVENIYNNDVAKLESDAHSQTIAGENSYYAAYGDNAVQRAINERNIRTSMAQQGITDSGLNRTQLSAVELQKANADLAVGLQRQSYLNKIKSQLNENKFALTKQKNEQINSIDNALTEQKNGIANSEAEAKQARMEEIINNVATITDPTAAAGYIKTVSRQYGIDGATLAAYSPAISVKGYKKYVKNENYYANKTSYKELHTSLASIDTTAAAGQTIAAKQIKAFANSNKKVTKTQIKKLCASAGISYSDYLKFLKDGQLFVKREEEKAKKASSSSYSGGGGGGSYSSGGGGSNQNDTTAYNNTTDNSLKFIYDYDGAQKYLKSKGYSTIGTNAKGEDYMIMTQNEYNRGYSGYNKTFDSYADYLQAMVKMITG